MLPLSCAFLADASGEQLRAILDSGAHFTSLSSPIVEMMERTFPGVQMRDSFSLGARQALHGVGEERLCHGA